MAPDPPPKTISSFSILPILYPPTSAWPHPVTHYLYYQRHQPHSPDSSLDQDLSLSIRRANKDPTGERSLFITNIPPDSTLEHFRTLLTAALAGLNPRLLGADWLDALYPEQRTAGSVTRPVAAPEDMASRMDLDGASLAPNSTTMTTTGSGSKKRKRAPENAAEAVSAMPDLRPQTLHRSGGRCLLHFLDRVSCTAALHTLDQYRALLPTMPPHPSPFKPLLWPSLPSPNTRLSTARYQRAAQLLTPSELLLQAHVDSFMASHDALTEKHKRRHKRAREAPDAEGFVTVGRGEGGARNPVGRLLKVGDLAKKSRVGITLAGLEARGEGEGDGEGVGDGKEGGGGKKGGRGKGFLGDFYRFQIRERRKEREGLMRREFEADRERVGAMKRRRLAGAGAPAAAAAAVAGGGGGGGDAMDVS